jgi:hypothetical protein
MSCKCVTDALLIKAVKTKKRSDALAPLRRQLALARTELRQLYELAEQGVSCWNRIQNVERQAEKLERITRETR